MQVRDAYQRIRVHEDDDATQQYKGLLFVMINRYSASASEILLQQCKIIVGIIIGQNTFGKGTVQQSRSLNFIYDLDQSPLGVLQYTIQKNFIVLMVVQPNKRCCSRY